jgi:hypothetical protein
MNSSTHRKRYEKHIGRWLERLNRPSHVMWLFFALSFLETNTAFLPFLWWQ